MRIEILSNECEIAKLKSKKKGTSLINIIKDGCFIEFSMEHLMTDEGEIADPIPEIFVAVYDNDGGKRGRPRYRYYLPIDGSEEMPA